MELKTNNVEGDWQWMHARGEAIFNAKKEIVGLRGTAQDITKQKLAEEEIVKSETYVRSIIDSLKSSVCVIDETGKILKVNDAWVEFGEENENRKSYSEHADYNYFDVCDSSSVFLIFD